jgi:hypothetical protein
LTKVSSCQNLDSGIQTPSKTLNINRPGKKGGILTRNSSTNKRIPYSIQNTPSKITKNRSEFDFGPLQPNKILKALDLNSMATTEKKIMNSAQSMQFDVDNVDSIEAKHEDRY